LIKSLYKFLFVDDLLAGLANAAPVTPEPLKKKLMRDFSRFTLVAYILLVFNPVMPLIADKMAHTFWLEYHLISVHHVYGKAHVKSELAGNAKKVDKDKSANNCKTASDEFSHVITHITYSFSTDYFISKTYPSYQINTLCAHPDVADQPPKA